MHWLLLIVWLFTAENVASQKCPNHWLHRPGSTSCYRFWASVRRTWQQSRDVCKMGGADLLRFESEEEKVFIIDEIKKYPTSHEWWIGLKRSEENETLWQWTDGSLRNQSYIMWGSGEPNNYQNSEDCAEIWDNLLNDKDCNQLLQSVCERSIETPVMCDIDRGWGHLYPGRCYKYFTEPQTVSEARKTCEADFSKLLTLRNESDHQAISEFLQELNISDSWVNLINENATSSDLVSKMVNPQQSGVDLGSCLLLNSTLDSSKNVENVSCTSQNPYFCMKNEGECSLAGSLQFEDTCVVIETRSASTWSDADSYCNLRGMKLLEVTSKYFLMFLHTQFSKILDGTTADRTFWLGLRGTSNTSSWQSGNKFGQFESDIMEDVTGSGCAFMRYDTDKWELSECTLPRDVICTIQYADKPRDLPLLEDRYECPAGYQLSENKCFLLRHDTLDWFSAQEVCQKEGGSLATVHSASEHTFLFGLIKEQTWIGLSDTKKEGNFVWLNNQKPGEAFWLKGQPSGRDIGGRYSENCVTMTYEPSTPNHGRWDDNPCSFRRPYICQTVAELNIAYGRTASQSNIGTTGVGPEIAISGCVDRSGRRECCIATPEEFQPWWQLDLGSDYTIGKISIQRMGDSGCQGCKAMFRKLQVFVSNSSQPTSDSVMVYQETDTTTILVTVIVLDQPVRGRYVRLQIPDRREILGLCDVRVFPVSVHSSANLTTTNSNCYSDKVPWLVPLSQTASGRKCQRWVSDIPHRHGNHADSRFPDGSQEKAENFCRDPVGEGMPWCYTLDPEVRWEFCPVQSCHELKNADGGDGETNDCGEGWQVDANTGSCFSLGDQPLMWADAESMCKVKGGHLAVVGNWGSEKQTYNRLFQQANTDALWLGVYGSSWPDPWMTVDGTINFTPPKGEKLDPPESSCVYLDKTDGPKVGRCLQKMAYICHKSGSLTTYTSRGDDQFIPIKSPQGKYEFAQSVLKFEFKGKNSAVILIQKDINNRKNGTCEITLCGFLNTKSFIKVKDDTPKVSSTIRNLCSDQEYRAFWIVWSDVVIQVGKGDELLRNVFMTYRFTGDQDQLYSFVSVRTDNGEPGRWKIQRETPTTETEEYSDVNLALKKPVKATHQYSSFATQEKAVDGCVDHSYGSGCCFHSAYEKNPWWQVDLGKSYPIKQVVITRRWDCEVCKRRLNNFRLFLSEVGDSTFASDIVYTGIGITEAVLYIDTPGKFARYVKIDIPLREEYLELCEVKVLLDQDVSACGQGWTNHVSKDVCYFFNTNKMSWHNARAFCKAHGGDLAVIRSAAEELFIFEKTENLKQDFTGGFWLGYHDLSTEGRFQTVDGSAVTFTDWGKGEPNDYGNGEDCAALRADTSDRSGKWNDSPCHRSLSFICKKNTNPQTTVPVTMTTTPPITTALTTTPFVPANISCTNGWSGIDGSNACYQVNIEPVTFYQAYLKCMKKQARLTDIPERISKAFTEYLRDDPSISGKKWAVHDGLLSAGVLRYGVQPGSNTQPAWSWWFYKSRWNPQWNAQLRQDLPDRTREYCSTISLHPDNFGNLIDFPCTVSYAKGYVCRKDEAVDVGCEDGWYMDVRSKICYKISDDSKSWPDANKRCAQEYGATLATLRDNDDMDFLAVVLRGVGNVWIGAHDQFDEGTWEWVDRIPWSADLRWASGQPDNWRTNEHCGMLIDRAGTRQLNDGICAHSNQYICKKIAAKITDKTEVTTEVTTVSSSSQMPPSSRTTAQTEGSSSSSPVSMTTTGADGEPVWIRTPLGVELLFSKELVTWAVARQNCLDKGGDLISLHSNMENLISNAVLPQRGKLSSDGFWIGLNALEKTGRWLWSDKAPVAFFKWESGHPLNLDGLQCVSRSGGLDGTWRDVSCLDLKPYMCAKRTWNVSEPEVSRSSDVECPGQEWRRYGDSCYLFVESGRRSTTWTEAVQACTDRKAHLVTISHYLEQSFVYSYLPHDSYCSNLHTNDTECNHWAETGECDQNPVWMSTHCHKACQLCMHNCRDRYESPEKCMEWMRRSECQKNPEWMIPNCAEACGVCQGAPSRGFWIGLTTEGPSGTYKWHNDELVSFTNWDMNQPVFYGRRRTCSAMFLSTGMWNDGKCEAKLPGYVCERPADVPSTGSTTPSTECQRFIAGDCVRVLGKLSTYPEAEQWCTSLGGNLPRIAVYRVLGSFGYLNVHHDDSLWIDHDRNGEECEIVTITQGGLQVSSVPCKTNQLAMCLTPAFSTPQTTNGSSLHTTTEASSCSPGWQMFEDHCYKVGGQNESETAQWHEAKRQCEEMGALLVSVHSEEEENFIQSLLHYQDDNIGIVWIGLRTSSDERNFKWADGTVLDYTNWVAPEPNNFGGGEDCAVMSVYAHWNDLSCYRSIPYVCKVPKGKAVSAPPPPIVYENCEGDLADWSRLNGSCYLVVETYYTWQEAQANCQRMGANLASLHCEDERNFLLGLFPKLGHMWIEPWIGYNDITWTKRWSWSDGSPVDYIRWMPGEPNSQWFSERCASLTGSGMYRDDGCETERESLCKISEGGNVTVNTTLPVTDDVPKGCPLQFYAFGDRCFHIGQTPMNFSEAADACFEMSSSLASIHSQMEQDFLFGQAMSLVAFTQQNPNFWIGFKVNNMHDEYHWMDNSVVDFTYWKEDPDSYSYYFYSDEGLCSYIQEDGSWSTAPGDSLFSYICARPQSPEYAGVTTTVDPARQCPPKYGNIGYTCLRLVTSTQSWDQSRAICKLDGGDLATIENNMEFSQARLALLNLSHPVWFGGSFMLATGFHWITGGGLKLTIPWNGTVSDGYMYYQVDGSFNTGDKDTNKAALCMIRNKRPNQGSSTPSTTSTTTSAQLDCRNGTLHFRGYCYMVVANEQKDFADAIMACARFGMVLASIHNDLENQALSTYVTRQQGVAEMYIGLVQHKNTPSQWLDRSPVNYQRHILGNENNPCTVLSSLDTGWYHVPCYKRLGYICKGKPDVPYTTQRTRETTSWRAPDRHRNNDTGVSDKVQSTGPDDSSLSSGEVAGIVIGISCVIVLVVVGLYLLRSMMLKKSAYPVEQQSLGFDNALFQRDNDSVNLN